MIEHEPIADVLVVGAGPAGASAAHQCATRGLSTILIDKQRFPRAKVCGCCLSAAACDALERMGLGSILDQAIPQERVLLRSGRRVATIEASGGKILSRLALDQSLVAAARGAGAEFADRTRAIRTLAREEFVEVELDHGAERRTMRARVLVVAEGLAGRLPNDTFGSRVVRKEGAIGVGSVLGNDAHAIEPGVIDLATGPGGYLGLARLETGEVDLAAAIQPVAIRRYGSVGAALQSIATHCDISVGDLDSISWKGTPTLTSSRKRIAARRIFVIGDAASYLEPITGEGMGWAIATGASVARVVQAAVACWDDSLIAQWNRRHRELVPARRGLCASASALVRVPRLARAAVGVLASRPDVAGSLARMTSRRFAIDVVRA